MEQTRYLPGKAHIRYGIWAVSSLMLILLFVLSRQAFAASSVPSVSDRLITVYDQGDERTFVTRTATIGDALREAGVTLSDADVVEPRTNTKMAASNYQVNIYRARPIVIEDGASKLQVTTAEQTPKRIMAAAGATMYDEDKAHIELSQNPLADGGAGLRLVVDRATTFTFNLYGKTFTARTQATTVGAMLKEKNISLGAQDGKSASDKTPLVAGMSVSVWRDGKQTITQEEVVAKPIEEIKDADRDKGYREVRTTGQDGTRQVTYEIDVRNGQEIARKEIASVTTKEPVKEVVVVGTKVAAPTYSGSHADWMAAAGIAASDFGYVEKLIQKESGWNPNAMNSSSGACGLVQALPCSKLGPNWNDPVVALRWGQGYVTGRYGGWAGAWAHSASYGWY